MREFGTLHKNFAGLTSGKGTGTDYAANTEVCKERSKAFYETYKERICENVREYNNTHYHNNKDKSKEYCEKNKERIREYLRKYYETRGK